MHFDKAAVAAGEAAERAQRFDYSGAARPAGSRASGESDHRDLAAHQRLASELLRRLRDFRTAEDLRRAYVLDTGAGRQPVLGQTDAAGAQVCLDLLMLDTIE